MSTQAAEVFVWLTQTGQKIPVDQMGTSHLFNSLRMIWNHTAPATMQLPGGRYDGVQRWPVAYRQRAVAEFIRELATRPKFELSSVQWGQIGLMRDWAASAEFQKQLNK